MKFFDWSLAKNEELKSERDISFEGIVFSIMHGGLLDIIEHHNPTKYPNQRIFIVKMEDYAYLVPFAEAEQVIFLKTIIPSRKMARRYLGGAEK
ncbi:MAG: toxin [Chloroflexi bacterium]|nr:toxin [Chloroflexota bacterium]